MSSPSGGRRRGRSDAFSVSCLWSGARAKLMLAGDSGVEEGALVAISWQRGACGRDGSDPRGRLGPRQRCVHIVIPRSGGGGTRGWPRRQQRHHGWREHGHELRGLNRLEHGLGHRKWRRHGDGERSRVRGCSGSRVGRRGLGRERRRERLRGRERFVISLCRWPDGVPRRDASNVCGRTVGRGGGRLRRRDARLL
jgi:hypothetical protein